MHQFSISWTSFCSYVGHIFIWRNHSNFTQYNLLPIILPWTVRSIKGIFSHVTFYFLKKISSIHVEPEIKLLLAIFPASNLFLHQNNEFGVGFQTPCAAKTLKRPYIQVHVRIQVHARELFETSCCCCSCLWQWRRPDYLLLFFLFVCSMIGWSQQHRVDLTSNPAHMLGGVVWSIFAGGIACRWKTCLPVLLTCRLALWPLLSEWLWGVDCWDIVWLTNIDGGLFWQDVVLLDWQILWPVLPDDYFVFQFSTHCAQIRPVMTFGNHHLRGWELVSFKLISDLRGLYLTDGSSAVQSQAAAVEPWPRCHDDAPMPSLTSSISLESVALSPSLKTMSHMWPPSL